ncbi:poly(3-hydroxybutyrate) depolymerase-like [Branchiostoma lanceolatum]|uniref:poly(3-hydroxybutyrate) depolymerase-like n=1 Tax=Branchiostoma lanceolatum TaxID=7740 RepID=UPI00345167DE
MWAFLLLLAASGVVLVDGESLGRHRADPDQVSVSGMSSGACFAVQFHVAHSRSIMGAGIFAGAPYLSYGNPLIDVSVLETSTNAAALTFNIDGTTNMRGDRVYLFTGANDVVVPSATMRQTWEYYKAYVENNNIQFVANLHATHGMPTADYGGQCDQTSRPNYLNNCDYNGAYHALNHIYGSSQDLVKPDPYSDVATRGQVKIHLVFSSAFFRTFDQGEFFYFTSPSAYSMDDEGFVYIPSGCAGRYSDCKLHIHLHGCNQGKSFVGDYYARHAGFNEVGELNNIIILYPQVTSAVVPVNPMGCWDWWGYTGGYFATRNGFQITAVHRMMERLLD